MNDKALYLIQVLAARGIFVKRLPSEFCYATERNEKYYIEATEADEMILKSHMTEYTSHSFFFKKFYEKHNQSIYILDSKKARLFQKIKLFLEILDGEVQIDSDKRRNLIKKLITYLEPGHEITEDSLQREGSQENSKESVT